MSVVESSEVRYGRVLEGAHIAGYTFARMQTELLWLLEGTRWKEVSSGFSDVNDFLRSIDLSAWKIEDRPKLVRAIKAAQPKASNRAIADAVGVSHPTVNQDVNGKNFPPAFADGEQAQKAAAKAATKKQTIKRNAGGAHEGVAAASMDASGMSWKLLIGDFRERLLELPDGSVNLVITDPPYPEEYLPLWEDVAREASRLLVKGGILVARCPHLFLSQILNMVGGYLQFGWVYAEPLPGSNVRFQGRKIAVAYQPWIAFSNGAWPSGSTEWHPDLLEESPRTKKRYVWEQKPTVAAELIATFTSPGNDVLDPFAGSGAYGEAALGVGCRWIGVELDPAGHAQAAERLRGIAA